jgi:hypothetical protein
MKPSFLNKAEIELWLINCNYKKDNEQPKRVIITNVAITRDYDLLYKQIWDIHFTKYSEDEIITWDGVELTRAEWLENNIKLCEHWLSSVYPKWLTGGNKLYDSFSGSYAVKHLVERYYENRGGREYIMEEALLLACIRNKYPIRIQDTRDISHILGMSKADRTRILQLCVREGNSPDHKETLIQKCRRIFDENKEFYLDERKDYDELLTHYSKFLSDNFKRKIKKYHAGITLFSLGETIRKTLDFEVGKLSTFNCYPLLEACIWFGLEPKYLGADNYQLNLSPAEFIKLEEELYAKEHGLEISRWLSPTEYLARKKSGGNQPI